MNLRFDRRRFMTGTAGATLATSVQGLPEARAQAPTRVTVRIDREFTNLDPGFRTGPFEGGVIRTVNQRLMKQKPNSAELELDAASEVKQTSPTTVEFRLKPGQMFTDGFGEMTAEDVKFSFERIGLPPAGGARPSPYRADWASLDRVEVTGQHTGRIVLAQPRANLFDVAIGDVSGCIVSRRAVEARGAEYATKPIGSGPYMFADYERQRGATLKRNPAFSGARPTFEEVVIRSISDPRTTDLALRSGEIDFASLSPAMAEPLRSVQGLRVVEEPSIAFVWLGMNVEKPPLNDIRVRQAIRLGVDVDQMLIAGYNGKAPRLNTVLPPQILGHWREAPVYRRNVAEARRLLQAAGASNLRLRLTLLNQPAFQNMALVARALLQEIGITIDVDAQESGTFWTAGQGDAGRNLDLTIQRFAGKHDPNFLLQWYVSGQIGTWNWQRWSNAEFDRTYQEAAAELDRARRIERVTRLQQLMDESSAFVWLTNEVNAIVSRSWLKPSAVPGWLDWQYDSFTTV